MVCFFCERPSSAGCAKGAVKNLRISHIFLQDADHLVAVKPRMHGNLHKQDSKNEIIWHALLSFSFFFFSLKLFLKTQTIMRNIGIDMGKDSFHVSFSDKHIVEFENTKEGISYLMQSLEEKKHIKQKTRIGVESTGVYHLPLVATLSRESWNIAVINPLISSRAIQNDSLRRVKTDKKDARIIRTLTGQGKGYTYRDTDELTLSGALSERFFFVPLKVREIKRIIIFSSTFTSGSIFITIPGPPP
ncbi:hypothetical protein A2W54_04530 [Candidatus Giovannonibacteria bacterium RIFCSPHIGHO2_02_43_13]|uniref:Transposase IS110-like N-terminal domain-containing protein n=1 Tax=Candidatus Giovannonibacteria bacterium RIFCSPHIGHO2_02_43_13 TaxID=1798330 RepID=A0A1F5WRQ0_9BACT|nr:MAG: Transposase [Parcubacteria group bacterium GW2011_GWA2_44_13]OGF71644.1 MAG: hypothetical protein A3E06_00885 [Candidatus Giovannonibacteria bacterium RIFCSPHIGHO2_12_FULL_44_42]OGF78328.1 MAG: hypothetical protein A2W54_04530 [Candidatus Giovannonibacteria bacterium RIFCSPHIGHO2_02_43_13]OGF89519.1 MAG: hypothetical protein A3I94_03265 [Candidatus Giovannonibacteria bacterium RIFCSPLOWO2_02_FULL_43_54]OGF96674.1 MAG: hypothetical protein A3H08_01915 [Candidatus Giovannonibacteria bacte